ncbi:hypothetical protein B0H19DRAFT_1270167 [Mycena capillaripes]|nr:hypothetical protein B0H19DRAFT_1270167 [Mycena capillaripes]
MAFTLIAVNLATLALGSLFYGIYLVLFFISIYLLLQRYNATHTSHKSRQNSSVFKSTVFISAILLFLVVTAHWTTIVYRSFIAYVALQHGEGDEAEKFFKDHTQISEVIQGCFMSLAVLIGDSLIIHRLWVVWNHSKLVLVVPAVSIITLSVGSFVSLNITSHSTDVFGNTLLKINTVLTLVWIKVLLRMQDLSADCNGGIAFITWKIWRITKQSMPYLSSGTNLSHFLVIVVESAGIYACWAVLFAVTYETQSNLQSTVIQTAPALVGIVNALIHTRVGLGWTSEQTQGLPWPSSPLKFAGRDEI